MRIELSTSTVHGTERGGEDLFVEVLCTSEVEPDPAYRQARLEAAWALCLSSLPQSQAEADERSEDLWLEGGRLRSYETEYEFKVNWTLAEARAKVERVVLEGDWVKRLKTGVYEVREDLYVDGNAD